MIPITDTRSGCDEGAVAEVPGGLLVVVGGMGVLHGGRVRADLLAAHS